LEKEKENTMGGACSTHGRDENCIQYFRWNTWRQKNHSEDLGVDGSDNSRMDVR
jgi:hypothetical protein